MTVLLTVPIILATPAAAIVPECSTALGCTGDVPAAMCGFPHQRIETGTGCNGVDNCQQPTLAKPRYEADPLPVTAGEPPRFRVRMTLDVQAPWNVWARQENPNGQLQLRWIEHPPGLGACTALAPSPGVETPGYYIPSLRDEKSALRASLEAQYSSQGLQSLAGEGQRQGR